MEPSIVRSPLWGVAYDAPREHELLLVAELPIDRAIREFVRGFVSASAPQRQELTTHLTWEDNDRTLIEFSKRSAVFALRGNSEQHLSDAFDALGIAVFQVRDPASLPSVVVAVATRLGANLSELYDAAECLGSGSSPRMLTQIRKSYPQGVSLEELGYEVVDTFRGPGLVDIRTGPPRGWVWFARWIFAKPTVWIPGLVLGFAFSVRSWDVSFAAGISSFCLALISWVWWRTDVAWRRWVALRKGQTQARPPGVLRRLVSGILFMFGAAMVCTWLPPMLGLASDKQLFMASAQLRIAQHAAGVVGLLLLFAASRVETRNV